MDWSRELLDQLVWHWENQLRPRLEGLTDDEYFWEPAPGAWNVRPRGESRAPIAAGAGPMVIEFAVPAPDPAPFTTIAWRLGHLVVDVLGARSASHFAGPAVDHRSHAHAATATQALAQLDEQYRTWTAGVAALGAEGLARACGPAEGPFAEYPMAALVLHTHREVIHHGAEISLLRDLHLHRIDDATDR